MPFLPLARALASALAPVLSVASPDSTLLRALPPRAPFDSTRIAPVPAPVVAPVATIATLPTPAAAPAPAPASAPSPTAAAKAALKPWDIPVPMPAWALGARTGLVRSGAADSIVVEKSEHRLTLFAGGEAIGTYLVALGKQPNGAKAAKGDLRTPEGLYHIDARNANSRFHRALHVSYPNDVDRARAQSLGVEPGGDIMIHGLPNGQGTVGAAHRNYDWTNGCVAVTDQEIEEIWRTVPLGTPVRIKP